MTDYEKALQIIVEVKKAVIGKDECIAKSVAAILAGGHILLNDIPGVGQGHVLTVQPRPVHSGCTSLRSGGIFRVSEGDRSFYLSAGKRTLQSLSGG